MRWNWQQSDWPKFSWDPSRLYHYEEQFLRGAGVLIGTTRHLGQDALNQLMVEGMSGEAITTSQIEGEILNRSSVQSSIQRQLGLIADRHRIPPAEQGISELMVDLYRTISTPLTDQTLFTWHRMVTFGRRDLQDIGRYRASSEPMQIVSSVLYEPTIHFEAPPSEQIPAEMARYIDWFNRTAPNGPDPLPALTRAGLSHLYFESIHPFEDGNGRIGRAIAEKALVQSLGETILIALGTAILAHHRKYYDALEAANQQNEVTNWLVWFAQIAIDAQSRTTAQVEFLIAKTRVLDRLRGQLNPRQSKAILRMFAEGPEGFKGGLSANNYTTITGATLSTTTRDLADLVEKGALLRTGEHRYTRYHLKLAPTIP